ncbi:MAG: hypothetical protein HY890_00685 [Deltaproteobacteria bacterium]|nr:hypothetical protein [Deltaproteobacteria bacterium]
MIKGAREAVLKYQEMDISTVDKRGRLVETGHTAGIMSLLEGVDGLMDDTRRFTLIKDDRATTVGVAGGPQAGLPFDVVIKRFNYKGALHSMAKRFSGTRARRLYGLTLELFKRGLGVPDPIGFLEDVRGRNSFYVSKFIAGAENLALMWKDGRFEEPHALTAALAGAIAGWHARGAVHGDLKWSNMLVKKGGRVPTCFFIDLDNARLYPEANLKGMVKDLERFYRYALRLGAREWVDEEFLPAYLKALPERIREKIGPDRINKIREDAGKKSARKRAGCGS